MRSELFSLYLHQSVHFVSFLNKFNADLNFNPCSLASKIQAKLSEREPYLKGKSSACCNALLKFDPIIVRRFLRVGGRLDQASLSYDQKHPLVLADNDRFTSLIIQRAHQETHHAGIQDTINFIRLQYWILRGRNRGRNAVKSIIKRCHVCFSAQVYFSYRILFDCDSCEKNFLSQQDTNMSNEFDSLNLKKRKKC